MRKWHTNKTPADKTAPVENAETEFPYRYPASFGKAKNACRKGTAKKSSKETSGVKQLAADIWQGLTGRVVLLL